MFSCDDSFCYHRLSFNYVTDVRKTLCDQSGPEAFLFLGFCIVFELWDCYGEVEVIPVFVFSFFAKSGVSVEENSNNFKNFGASTDVCSLHSAEPEPVVEDDYSDEEIDVDELERRMWRDKMRLKRLKEMNKGKEGVDA
ncbi:UNVERIFIED_CONTAM: protein ETHYLENE INSENSITIVE 3 [Sesamum calycinum]|uniref:Protein ETHYLENE INSENSITIVE 3 n=1 Tax=Sesamum calycinum TaxID=2727403 RepID=A0AAW2J2Y7_9LAMI